MISSLRVDHVSRNWSKIMLNLRVDQICRSFFKSATLRPKMTTWWFENNFHCFSSLWHLGLYSERDGPNNMIQITTQRLSRWEDDDGHAVSHHDSDRWNLRVVRSWRVLHRRSHNWHGMDLDWLRSGYTQGRSPEVNWIMSMDIWRLPQKRVYCFLPRWRSCHLRHGWCHSDEYYWN